MVVDTSVLVAIYLEEPGQDTFVDLIDAADEAAVSVVSRFQTMSVLCSRRFGVGRATVETFLDALGLDLVAVSVAQMERAISGMVTFGKGRHPARLNFGDCFAYGLAAELRTTFLFKGDDFALTDVTPARRPEPTS